MSSNQSARVLSPPTDPHPASSQGNPAPRYRQTLDLPEKPSHAREGRRLDLSDLGAGGAGIVDLARCRKILVVKLDFIGDWVLTTPFLAGLRRSAPHAEITVVVLDRVFDLARACRFADRVISVAPADRGPVRLAAASAGDRAGFLADYGTGAFDLALVPRWDTDFNGALRIAAGSRASALIGFSETCTERRRVQNRGDDRFYTLALVDPRQAHEVEHNQALIAALGGAVGDGSPQLDIAPSDRGVADRFARQAFAEPRKPLLAVAPFAAGARRWPTERTAALTRRLADRFGLDPVVVASPDDGDAAGRFARLLGPGAASAAGLRLGPSAALIARAAVLIGMDSGPAHVAAAVGTPSITISAHPQTGSANRTGAPQRFRPWGDGSRVLVVQPRMARPPCVDGCDAGEPHCILDVNLEDWWPQLEALVRAAL